MMDFVKVTEQITHISFGMTWASLARDSRAVLAFPGGRCYAIHHSD